MISAILSIVCSVSSLKASGRHLVDEAGNIVLLHGVSHSGTEFACVGGYGIFDGSVDNASIVAMHSWNINVVRIPLNEDCWLGINGVSSQYSGSNYQYAISDYINRLWAHGIYSILDLHWSAPGSTLATKQNPMPDKDHSGSFWASVASWMGSRPYVIFDIFNEPFVDSYTNGNATAAWECWLNGGWCPGIGYQAVGMQSLIQTIRSTDGASNLIMVGGLRYANDLTQWLAYKPYDPLSNIAASTHIYNFNSCIDASCWDQTLSPIINSGVPVIIGEFGENDCQGWFVNQVADWFTQNEVSHLAWTWNTWNCDSGPALISNYDGTCTDSFGCTVKQLYTG